MDYSHTRVRLTPVPSSGETAWLLRGNDNTIIFSGGPYDILSGLVRETVAVKESATYELLLRDSFGDGIFSGSIIVYLSDGSNTADDRALLFLDGGFRRFISGKFVADDAGILPDFALASFAPTSLFAPLPFSPAPSVTPTTRTPSISPAPSRTKVDVTVRLSFDVEAVSDWKELKDAAQCYNLLTSVFHVTGAGSVDRLHMARVEYCTRNSAVYVHRGSVAGNC